ncbi:hypothetical protein BBD42_11375 [Paenibacillus sp. BIHB 4019]|uniref:CBS domain-containing protein n=1 Tax=Paenibacillus sp. BIHB 4019 TaxID=1870819 RepID=A0A1B2DH21_9BACL|nr:hypothetical protein [Paenibacillus sp. BIHB 4019]ANY67003.1 hypothetical protein BBD42_11375 [Paenibacillus sp. BIHB 4019]
MTGYASDAAAPTFVPQLNTSQTCYEALQLLRSYPEAPCAVVCNSLAEPVGLVMRDRFFLQLSSSFLGYYQTDITKLMNTRFLSIVAPSADTGLSPDTISSMKNKAIDLHPELRSDCIVITNEQGQFVGIIDVAASETAPAYV